MRHALPPRAFVACAAAALAMTAAAQDGLHEVRGARLFVQSYGTGAPIVFPHGGLHHFANTFAAQRDFFAAFRRVIGIDQRGHGRSPDNDQPFSYREMAEDTAALIRGLGVAPVDLVGHSDGGNVALLVARFHPDLVRKVVVSGANLRASHPPDELQRRAALPRAQIAERLGRFRADYLSVSPNGAAHWPVFAEKSWHLWLTPVLIETAELRAIRAPVVVAGDRDLYPLEETVELYRGLARGELLIVPGTGHATFQDRPDVLNAAIRSFLDRPDSAPRTP